MSLEHKLSRRAMLRLSGTAAAASLLAACGPEATPEVVEKIVEKEVTKLVEGEVVTEVVKETVVVEKQVVQEQVTLRYAGWVFGNWQQLIDDLTARFTEQHPNIRIESELGDWTANQQKLFAQVAAGFPPDVGMGWWHQLIAEGRILDCTPFVDRDHAEFNWDNYFPFCYEWARYDQKNATLDPNGGTYIFAMAAYGTVWYYNKKLFDEAGVAYPTDDWTWADLLEMATQLTKDMDGNQPGDANFDPANVDVWGASGLAGYYPALQYARNLGGDVLQPDYSAAAMREDPWVQTFTYINDAVNTYNVHPGGAAGGVTPEGGFMSGKVAMEFNFNWVLAPYLSDITDFEWAMAPQPMLNGKRESIALPDANVIFKDTRYPEEAWTFMKYFMSEEVNRDYISKELPPPFQTVALSDTYLAPLAGHYPEALQRAWEEGRNGMADRAIEHWAGKVGDAIGSLLAGEFGSVEEALDWTAEEIDKVRAQYIVP
ncbi:MAG: ABC transporter substrate-binding protein [Anaerolineae bacterium]